MSPPTRTLARAPLGRRRARAFTLIELIVAAALSIVVIGIATAVMANAVRDGRRARVHAEMMRDASFTGQVMSQELRQAGLGVPNARHISAAFGTAPGQVRFYASVLVAAVDQVGIVGDLPRADANYNAYGPLHNRTLAGNVNVVWHTENNGACAPDVAPPAGSSCTTGATSVFFPGENGCDATSDFNDRTCPWGLRRVTPGERIIAVSGDGRWSHAAFANPGALQSVLPSQVLAASLTPGFALPLWPAPPPPPALVVVSPGDVPGQGWVATLDRVFFRYNATARTIERIQCSGDPDPDDPGWPDASATSIPSLAALAFTPAGGSPPHTCGPAGFEVIARNVESLTLSYFDGGGTIIAQPIDTAAKKLAVRRVAYRIRFSRVVDGRPVSHDVAGSVGLRNL